jgi:hypothetical protein
MSRVKIRTYDPGIQAIEDSSYLRPLSYRDKLYLVTALLNDPQNKLPFHWTTQHILNTVIKQPAPSAIDHYIRLANCNTKNPKLSFPFNKFRGY